MYTPVNIVFFNAGLDNWNPHDIYKTLYKNVPGARIEACLATMSNNRALVSIPDLYPNLSGADSKHKGFVQYTNYIYKQFNNEYKDSIKCMVEVAAYGLPHITNYSKQLLQKYSTSSSYLATPDDSLKYRCIMSNDTNIEYPVEPYENLLKYISSPSETKVSEENEKKITVFKISNEKNKITVRIDDPTDKFCKIPPCYGQIQFGLYKSGIGDILICNLHLRLAVVSYFWDFIRCLQYIKNLHKHYPNIIIGGDFNITVQQPQYHNISAAIAYVLSDFYSVDKFVNSRTNMHVLYKLDNWNIQKKNRKPFSFSASSHQPYSIKLTQSTGAHIISSESLESLSNQFSKITNNRQIIQEIDDGLKSSASTIPSHGSNGSAPPLAIPSHGSNGSAPPLAIPSHGSNGSAPPLATPSSRPYVRAPPHTIASFRPNASKQSPSAIAPKRIPYPMPDDVTNLTPEQVGNPSFPRGLIQYLSQYQIQYISPNLVRYIGPQQIPHIGQYQIPYITFQQVPYLIPRTFPYLRQDMFQYLIPLQLQYLKPEQLQYLTPQQIPYLPYSLQSYIPHLPYSLQYYIPPEMSSMYGGYIYNKIKYNELCKNDVQTPNTVS